MQPLSPHSYWFATGTPPSYPPLPGDREYDVAIIGGGITGLTTALLLKQQGVRVVVLEAGTIGSGTTGGTTAHADCHPEDGFQTLINDFGRDGAKVLIDARRAAIDQIERLAQSIEGGCDFVRVPAYWYTENARGAEEMRSEFEAAQRLLGDQVSLAFDVPLPWKCSLALRLENQGRFHVMRYLQGLAAQVHGDGSAIHEQTRVLHAPEDGEPCIVETNHGIVRANAVVAATHSAFFGISLFDTRVAPYQSYVLTAEVEDEVGDALFWDNQDPYHYIRRASSEEPKLCMIGGCDHKTGQGDEEQAFADLEAYTRKKFRVREIRHRWSAELFEPDDGAPYIGRLPRTEHLYLCTGFSGTGITWGTAAASLITDQFLGRHNPLGEVVSTHRIHPMAAAGSFLKENLNVAKRFVVDRYSPEKVDDLDRIAPGEAKVVRYQGDLVAVYRDEQGIHACSAKCTHAGCIVQWNAAEHTWDCPCHGGRYDAQGRRIYGPPPEDLAPLQVGARSIS